MRSKIFFIIAATLLCVSCEKTFVMETELEIGSRSETFTATIECEPSTRTSLSDFNSNESFYSLIWSKGDAISISDGAKTAIYTTDDNYSSTAEFIRSEGSISNKASQYTAFYPSTITTSNMVLPATQNYVEDNVENFPMRAVSTSKDLSFKNLCGIIRFSLKSEEIGQISISSISLSADKGMSGTFTVSEDNAAVVSENNGVILSCGVPQSLYRSSTTDFNIIVPKGSYNPLKVKITDSDGREINLVSEEAITVKRSEITRITLTLAKSAFETSLETIPITDSDVDFTER
jgi:hypothetical protein